MALEEPPSPFLEEDLLLHAEKPQRCRLCTPCCKSRVNRAITALSLMSLLFLLGGTLLPWAIRAMVKQGIKDAYVIDSPDASGYEKWQDTSKAQPTYYKLGM